MSKTVSELLVVVQGGRSGFTQDITARQHRLTADEPTSSGGEDMGATPYELLLAALGACTSITLRMYARQKKWPLEEVVVRLGYSRIHAADCAECETKEGILDRIDRELELKGPLTQEQKARLLEIAEKCPVHRTLTSEVNIRSWLR